MSKYRLIKKYPGSPELGTIITQTNGYGMTYIEAHKYPEFWEEVVEKDYEILSFKSKCEQYRILDTNTGLYKYFKPGHHELLSKKYLIQEGSYQIHSVKRLIDGEVFTIGDKVRDSLTDRMTDNKVKTISHFSSVATPGGGSCLIVQFESGITSVLSNISKVEKPLFTTEDGVDVYVGDRISTVLLSDMEIFTADGLVGRDTKPAEGFKYFSTKEKAEEHILMNKPCLSVADICTYFDGQLSGCSNLFYLKKLAKSKLNESKD